MTPPLSCATYSVSFVADLLNPSARHFLDGTVWSAAACEPLTGDASVRKYFRLRQGSSTAILMDASAIPQTVVPFIEIDQQLRQLGFSAPEILLRDELRGLLLLEDFGDDTFARLLDRGSGPEPLFALATDVLITLHRQRGAPPKGLRTYHSAKMLADLELFLDWCTPKVATADKAAFREVWSEVLPLAHCVPVSLLLRDYHAANLMMLSEREGPRRAGLLDFQDAYAGPITYDLMSLLEDARRDVPPAIKEAMTARYLAQFPELDPETFRISLTIVAALRHTRVLAIFERLSRSERKNEYKRLHYPRVQSLLHSALRHPVLAGVKRWLEQHAW